MIKMQRRERRRFLRSVAGSAAAAVVSQVPLRLVAHAAGNEVVRVGLVGCGARGAGAAMNALHAGKQVQLVAMGDVFSERLASSLGALQNQARDQVQVAQDRCFVGFDAYQSVINSGVDLVLLATPPHFRPAHFEAAVAAGKHVFLETPMAIDPPGVRKLLAVGKLASSKGIKVGASFGPRRSEGILELVARLRDGAIGRIRHIEAAYEAPPLPGRRKEDRQTEMQYQLSNWYFFCWLSGDILVGQATHRVDLCSWVKGVPPARAVGSGDRREFTAAKHGDIFNHFEVDYSYSDGTSVRVVSSNSTGRPARSCCDFTGDAGTAVTFPQAKIMKPNGSVGWVRTAQERNMYDWQLEALISAIRDGRPFNEIEDSATSTMTSIMGRMAAYTGREITWDEAFNSNERLGPDSYSWEANPPTLPDKFGDYLVPARGRASRS